MILAPLRGVTIRCFREVFADVIRDAGFTEAVTPFIPAIAGYDPLKDRELVRRCSASDLRPSTFLVTPQFIGKDPVSLKECLRRVKDAGYGTADLNAGCPYPMVRRKGRGSGLLRTPDVLKALLEVGCETMGPGRFSLKARLGVERSDELLALMPVVNAFPLRFLTVHARTARQMYEGDVDVEGFRKVAEASKVPVVLNGDVPFPPTDSAVRPFGHSVIESVMIGRSFVRALGAREDAGDLLMRYMAASEAELCGGAPVLGRMKELLSYWKDLPRWRRKWNVVKICRSPDELRTLLPREADL